ncbi:MAG: redoxin domain-containing protein [Verrucomicrobia bacterium]|nr:redoxin domain-containing protein [Verrucomicrobiota bacterium]
MNRILLAIGLLLVSLNISRGADNLPRTLSIGSSAPDFDLPGVDGRNYTLKDFSGSTVLVVVFTCNHCPTAQYYEERIKKLVEDYKAKGVALIAISPNDPKSVRLDELGYTDLSDTLDEMKIRARDREFNFPYLYDGETELVSKQYGPAVTPHAYVFDAARKLQYVGRIDNAERIQYVTSHELRDAIDAVLDGKTPAVQQTKVVGCSVKWAGKEDSVLTYMEKLATEKVSVEMADAAALKKLRKNESGKLRLVNFWATWCGPCITEFPELVTINRMYRHRDFEFVAVAANYPDEEKDVLKFLQKQQASNRNLLFGEPDKYKLIDAFDGGWDGALPYSVLIDPDGKLLYRQLGAIDPIELRRAILKALNERKPW